MTLRVTFEIVPYGDEANKYEIAELNIHNKKDHGLGYCEYYGSLEIINAAKEVSHYKFDSLMHSRQDGFQVLVEKVLKELNNNKENHNSL